MFKRAALVNSRAAAPALLIGAALSLLADPAAAHVSESGFVLLLPTAFYTAAGAATVGLTVLALTLIPSRWSARLIRPVAIGAADATPPRSASLETILSLLSVAAMAALIVVGLVGARDPLSNPLPLSVWTVFWIGLLSLQGIFGDLWRFLNPWTGLHRLLAPSARPLLTYPERLGAWPGVIGLIVVAGFAFAHPAPDDPARLAVFVASYWALNFFAVLAFGPDVWLARGECLSMLARLFAGMAPIVVDRRGVRVGLPGWRLPTLIPPTASTGVFALVALGVGSFDGLNETFWWLSVIGVNPLEFPGRSAIIPETIIGLLAANLGLIIVFAATVWIGLRIAQSKKVAFETAFARLAITVTPISLGYHIAHYLVTALINGQYVIAAASDPLGVGADYLGLGVFYVTTGFLNTLETVEMIFRTQAGAVVIGHVLSIFLAHAVAVDLLGGGRRAAASQIPLAGFMIAYTFLGLWLLASPKGA